MIAEQIQIPKASPYRVGRFYFHINEFDEARPWLKKAALQKPWKLERWTRLAISHLPRRMAAVLAGSRRRLWHQLWEEALKLPGYPTIYESALNEMSEYLKISKEEALRLCQQATTQMADEWKEAAPQSADQIMEFYRTNTTYIADLIHERSKPYEFGGHHAVEALLFALEKGAQSCLDFGSGDGSCGLLYAHHGLQASMADVSSHLLEFVRWRFAQRGLEGKFYLMPGKPLPEKEFDLITSFDTLEHVADPLTALNDLYRSLKPGGHLIANTPFGCTENHPMHLPHDRKKFIRGAKDMGFAVKSFRLREFYLFQKI
ncbi:MAG: class I SAM-dependent methyltransferase [Elusimicrobia bacterium]|nr:class I SAM-dependent methyltransferase [Elusimicrobiota bacterium]